jgi:hypothetical protein
LESVIFKKTCEAFKSSAVGGKVLEVREDFDYVYDFEVLRDLKGNKFHKKRNHVNKFRGSYDWSFERITPDNIHRVEQFCEQWFQNRDAELMSEYKAIKKVVEHLDVLDCDGGILFVDDHVVGFTIGEVIDDTLLIHFEKADTSFHGAYTMLMHQYLLQHEGLKWINREQDLGIEGLRKSKMSYHPVDFIKKYTVIY